jgi:aminopeptidase-like protein
MSLAQQLDDRDIGETLFATASAIYPICRSLTGAGVRQTLDHLAGHIALDVHEVPTGAQVLDWTIPREWTIRDAYIKNERGEKVVDIKTSNLHVLNYSRPVHETLPLAALKEHVFSLPDQPDLIPYRTSYYAENWGFCMAHNQLSALPDGLYEAVIDSSLNDGSLTYGDYLHKGETEEEILLSAHICHPSLANDNCSGLALLTHLAERLAPLKTRYSYRFLFAPGTIGAIAWLARNEDRVARIRHGLVLSCVGDGGGPTYKKSRRGDAVIDRAMAHVLADAGETASVIDFFPYGYDERQFCSPGFNLPVGLFQRSQFGTFPEYHTSADNLDFIRPIHLASSYRMIVEALDILERDWRPVSAAPKGEPQLGKRGLYDAVGGDPEAPAKRMAFLWILNLADGRHSLLDMAERAKLRFSVVADAADLLEKSGLLVREGRTEPAGEGV